MFHSILTRTVLICEISPLSRAVFKELVRTRVSWTHALKDKEVLKMWTVALYVRETKKHRIQIVYND